MDRRLEDRGVGAVVIFMFVGLGAAVFAGELWPVADKWQTLLPAVAGGIFAWLVVLPVLYFVVRRFPGTHPKLNLAVGAVVLLIGTTSMAWGALVGVNGTFDGAPPTSFEVKVLGMEHSGTAKSESWNVTLAPWGRRVEPENVRVSETLYRALSALSDGHRYVHLTVHTGALRWAWYELEVGTEPGQADD